MAALQNACAGPFGAVYDWWIERERVAQVVGRLVWGIDTRPMFASMREALASAPDGGTVIDVPCGGGVAFRALPRGQRVRYLAVDLDAAMLERARRRAAEHGLDRVEFVAADMRRLPFTDSLADLCLTFSGLHMIPDPEAALVEMARCLRPGGEIVGATFVADGSRRQRLVFALGTRTGHAHVSPSGTARDVHRWLANSGFVEVGMRRSAGFVLFRARRAS